MLCRGRLDGYWRAVERGGAAQSIDSQVISEVIDTGARVLLRDRQMISRTVVTPAMGNAHDARHHLDRYLQRQHDLTHARTHQHVLT